MTTQQTFSGSGVLNQLMHACLRPEDQALLSELKTLPEFIMRHELLADHPEPMPCYWMEFRNKLLTMGLGILHITAYETAPGFCYRNEPHEHERRRRLIMLFGVPSHRSEYSWGDGLQWCLSNREFYLFVGMPKIIKELKAKQEGALAEDASAKQEGKV